MRLDLSWCILLMFLGSEGETDIICPALAQEVALLHFAWTDSEQLFAIWSRGYNRSWFENAIVDDRSVGEWKTSIHPYHPYISSFISLST